MKKVPYGISNFKRLITGNMYYVDKTKYIEILEQKEDFQFFIRPRRFGKTLFLSLLDTYYDLNEKDNFDKYFTGLYIQNNKTPQANKYLVLKLNFATIITDQGKELLIESFDELVSSAVDECIYKYRHLLGQDKLPTAKSKATFAFDYIVKLVDRKNQKMILLIDEYDNFANNIMSDQQQLYNDLMHDAGYVRTFYKTVKKATATGVLTRIFMTGVSPITLDELTSGANMFANITNREDLNDMLGFTEEEVIKLIDYYELDKKVNRKDLLEILRLYCNGYKFNKYAEQTIYNTDMVLYIINTINDTGRYPDNLIDVNMKTDYTRLRRLAAIFAEEDEMIKIIQEERTEKIELKEKFNIESLINVEEKQTSLYSLLYYLGLLSIDKAAENKVILKIPNYAVKVLYWEYMGRIYNYERATNSIEITKAMEKMRLKGEVKDIFAIYNRFRNSLSNRDLRWYNETTSKLLFAMLAQIDGIYLIETEREASGGYADIYLKENVKYKEAIRYNYLIEFKHIKGADLKGDMLIDSREEILKKNREQIEESKNKAFRQLDSYIKEKNIFEASEKEIKKMIVITLGKKYEVYQFC
jgi:hypothetical protein